MSIANCLRLLAACLMLAPAAFSAQRSSDAAFAVHVVQRGENLFRIALKYDRLPEAIAEANGITDSESIAVGQRLIIPLNASAPRPPVKHFVVAGETLVGIAAAYDRSLADILALNSLSSADLIYVGQELTIIPGSGEATASEQEGLSPTPAPAIAPNPGVSHSFSRLGGPAEFFAHRVKSGETLSGIALRYNQSIDALARANNLADPGLLQVNQPLRIPGILLPQLTRALPGAVLAFTLEPLVFEAGRTARVELLTREPVTITGQFLGRELRVIERDGGRRHNILIGIPMFTKMDVYALTLELVDGLSQSWPIGATVQVISGGYGRQTIRIADSELLAREVETEEFAALARVTAPFTSERAWSNSLSLPAAAPINAAFGTLRSYNGSPFDRYHGGVDFAGAPGTSILAAADGVVVMVDRLQIRGNTTAIDHGWGLYTLYAHQDDALVAIGDRVEGGQHIGAVGSTGRSTGPHLHWEVWINGVNVDPMQWIQEVFP